MPTEFEPPAIEQHFDSAASLIAEARAIDADILTALDRAVIGMKRRGDLLLKAKAASGHGNWRETLKKHWPGLSERTASRYMAQAKSAKLADLKVITHKQLPDEDEDEEDDSQPLTEPRRRILISLIGVVDRSHAKSLLSGEIVLSDKELLKSVPPHCSRCDRLGANTGRPCEACENIRANYQADQFESQQEPEYEDDPASPPKPPPDELAELKSLTTKLAGHYTRKINGDGEVAKRLHDYMSWCGLIDHPPNGTPKFLPLVGMRCLMEAAGKEGPPLSETAVKEMYERACGAVPWIPPAARFRRARKAERGQQHR